MSPSQNPTVTIAPGVEMPLVGFGTWQASGDDTARALELGYRHIDTATMYANEREIGRAIAASGIPRNDIFVTTKLRGSDAGSERATIDASLEALGLDHVDLWLIHSPPRGQASPEVWQRFVEIAEDGLARAIGVSNYDAAQIDEITVATGVTPAVNQIEWSPAKYDAAVVEAHRARGVTLEGYSPFVSGDVDSPVLKEIAGRHGVTTRQVILRWHVEHEFVVIPKSSSPERMAANLDIFGFQLDADEVAQIDALGG